ncbi:restriction endonuclease subunit S [Thermus scotoductus]|uniref:restriction endonuclease subunit S n=1 Tax=Thermus scotoductus TaxID=37636 RepID=UPI0020A25739|nr:restriction endonuclease subunit S [Thermus scotoductus]
MPVDAIERVELQETEIGPLPAHWRVVRLREVVEKAKQVDPRKKPDWNFKYVDVSSISNTKLSIETWSEISGENAPSRARKLVKEGDIIFATVRPYLKRIAMVPAHLDGHVVSTAFCVIRCKAELATPNYVFFAVSLDNFVQRVVEQQRGSSYPAVTDKDVLNGLIPLPPLSEQREIARMLQAVDARIEAEEKKKAALEALFKTLLHHLMTAKIRLPEEFVARFAEVTP